MLSRQVSPASEAGGGGAEESARVRVGILGEAGSYSECAARALLGPLVRGGSFCTVAFQSSEDLFKGVLQGACHCGVVQLESTLSGSSHSNYDLLLRYSSLHILAEIDIEVEYCLLALPGCTRDAIRRVVSHESVLRECDDYLREWGVGAESRSDTGSAAKEIVEQRLADTAAIGSKLCAETYGLEVLAKEIQGFSANYRRSLLIGAEPCPVPHSEGVVMKTSVVFWLPHDSDALFKVLAVFSLRDINLTKMESRPVPAAYLDTLTEKSETPRSSEPPALKKYEYFCYVDVLDHHQSSRMQAAMKHLREITPFARILGSYPTDGADTVELCKALKASTLRASAASRTQPEQLSIAIIGFGNFGQFLAREFAKRHRVFATSKRSYAEAADALGCTWVPWENMADLLLVHAVDVLLISTSITSFHSVVAALPRAALAQVQPLVTEVCSVKTFPKSVLLQQLPEECDIVCTHPMFGPESGKHGWYGLPFVFEVVRARSWDRARRFLAIFKEARCRMVGMSCEEHDQYAAASQFLTHLTGRVLATHGCASTSVDLAGFRSLCKVVDTTCKDSFELFYGLFKYNPSSLDTIERLKRAFTEIERRLRFRRENSQQCLPAAARELAPPDDTADGEDPLSVSSFPSDISESKTEATQALVKQLQDEGREVNTSLCLEEPCYPPPAEVLKALERAVDAGLVRSTAVQGELELRRCICADLRARRGLEYEPEQICVSNGAGEAVYQALLAVCGEDDEVLVPTPCPGSYHDAARLCRAVPVDVPTAAADGHLLRPDALRAALEASGAKCKAVVLCNPGNPTGAVPPRDALEALAEVLRRPEFANVYVLADEVHERLVFGAPHVSFAAVEGMQSRTLLIGGVPLGDAAGLRLGYLAALAPIASVAAKLQGCMGSCASILSQRAGVVALRDVPEEWSQARVRELQQKRDYVVERLRQLPGVGCATPQGGFYVLADLSEHLGGPPVASAEEFCALLLREHGVALVPGEAFRAPASVRISYACRMEDLEAGMRAFGACVAALARRPA